ncbi:hypothetical protein VOM14_05820 [Paraburkholderia sp. MPAMCS5]|uniref:hypothetical protein n=1 Tax=Paraburkholderia sp. MPAMCS5 TaxID=3112563 RepID=UPI002E19D27A|nr:hypothetical protein [Paraburkholderia sp. MPAMCS5]
MLRNHPCTAFVGAPSMPEAADPYEAAESLQTLVARLAAIATIAASSEADTLTRHLHAELLGLLAELAQEANEAAEELTESLTGWLNRTEAHCV